MRAMQPDYDSDPGRVASWDPAWVVSDPDGDNVSGAARLAAEDLSPVLDVGCGAGTLAARLPGRLRWIGLDVSPTQLGKVSNRPVVRADALRLPLRDRSCGAVVCHWMLYHLDRPTDVIAEAHRVLRPGGLFLASTSARTNDPELIPGGYQPTIFDSEEAPSIVASVFGEAAVEVDAWDGPYNVLADRAAVRAYARHHCLSPDLADQRPTPLTLTKRGCLIWARRS